MNDPHQMLQALLQSGGASSMFASNSRYHAIGMAKHTTGDGREVVYLRRRFVPGPEQFTVMQEHLVVQGDRLDNLAAKYLGDPEQSWRLSDANGALRPDELVEVLGAVITITLPQGIAGLTHA
jgi:hypothetical protein